VGGDFGDRFDTCYLCQNNKYKRVFIEFTSGSEEPSEDNTLTGATSGASATVAQVGSTATVNVHLYSGTWAGGDAAGHLELKSYASSDADSYNRWGTENENLNSTATNNVMTLSGYGHTKVYALLYPEDSLVDIDSGKYAGRKLCVAHANAFLPRQAMDDVELDLTEDEREGGDDLNS